MNIVVLGATGLTGQQVTQMLLEQGHKVVAYVRTPSKISLQDPGLQVVQGGILDDIKLSEAMKDTDAVISCLGSSTTKPSNELEEMAKSIAKAMKKAGLSRIVYMATAGIEDEFKGPMKWLIHRMIGNVILDHKHAAQVFMDEGFDYTIAKPMQLSNVPPTFRYQEATHGLPSSKKAISRGNVADFMIKAVLTGSHKKESVALAQ